MDFLAWWQTLPSKMDPVLISIGPLTIYWYSTMYLVAFGVVYILCSKKIKKNRFKKTNTVMARSFSSRGYFLIHKVLRLEGLGSVTKKQQWKSPTHSPLYSLIMVARGRYAMVQHEQVLVSEPKPDLVLNVY